MNYYSLQFINPFVDNVPIFHPLELKKNVESEEEDVS